MSQAITTLTMTLDELRDVNESSVIAPIDANFDACYDAGYSLDKIDTQAAKMKKSVSQTMVCMASSMWFTANHTELTSALESEQVKERQKNMDAALVEFLGKCAAAGSRYKIRTGRTSVPVSTTQAKKNIKAAWDAGVSLVEAGTLSKMEKATKAIRQKEEEDADASALALHEEKNGKVEAVPLNDSVDAAGDVTTKTSDGKPSIKVEGLDPSSPLGKELKAFMDAVVNAHNNMSDDSSDQLLADKIAKLRGDVGKTVAYLANAVKIANVG